MNQKKICVIDVKTGNLMRLTKATAQNLINAGTAKPTSKGKMKAFLNKQLKLHKNHGVIRVGHIDFQKEGTPHRLFNDKQSGKLVGMIWKKDALVIRTPDPKNINPLTGRPVQTQSMEPHYEHRILSYSK